MKNIKAKFDKLLAQLEVEITNNHRAKNAKGEYLPLAIYALGGVDASNAAACAKAGAYGVAVIRALLEASDAGEVAKVVWASLVVS